MTPFVRDPIRQRSHPSELPFVRDPIRQRSHPSELPFVRDPIRQSCHSSELPFVRDPIRQRSHSSELPFVRDPTRQRSHSSELPFVRVAIRQRSHPSEIPSVRDPIRQRSYPSEILPIGDPIPCLGALFTTTWIPWAVAMASCVAQIRTIMPLPSPVWDPLPWIPLRQAIHMSDDPDLESSEANSKAVAGQTGNIRPPAFDFDQVAPTPPGTNPM